MQISKKEITVIPWKDEQLTGFVSSPVKFIKVIDTSPAAAAARQQRNSTENMLFRPTMSQLNCVINLQQPTPSAHIEHMRHRRNQYGNIFFNFML